MSSPPTSKLLDELLHLAARLEASDIHLKPGAKPALRIHNDLQELAIEELNHEQIDELLQELLTQQALARLEQTGEVDVSYRPLEQDAYRVNVAQQGGEPAVAMRRIRRAIPQLHELGLPEALSQQALAASGLFVVSGRTGAGKSTALAAMIGHLNNTCQKHIVTIEDPAEFLFDDLNCRIEQREVGIDTNNFESGFHNVLRQDPDVVVIGELRDRSGLLAALRAARTGRLVLTTMHAGTAVGALDRLLELLPGEQRQIVLRELGDLLNGVICLRLVPALAGARVPATELLVRNPAITKLMKDGELDKLHSIIAAGDIGMHSFNKSLADLVSSSTISREAAMEVTDNRSGLEMMLKGIVLHEERRIFGS